MAYSMIGAVFGEETRAKLENTSDKTRRDATIKRCNIFPHPQNNKIYSTSNLRLLAASIESNGLHQPLVVHELGVNEAGEKTYELLMGHRRLLAIEDIVKRNPDKAAKYDRIKCIIIDTDSPDEVLVDGNIGNRQKTNAEIAKEIEIKKSILERKAKSGDKLAANQLEFLAEDLNISFHQAKKINSINIKASDDTKTAFDEGLLSVDAAYALSRLDEKSQKEVFDEMKDEMKDDDKKITAKKIKDKIKKKHIVPADESASAKGSDETPSTEQVASPASPEPTAPKPAETPVETKANSHESAAQKKVRTVNGLVKLIHSLKSAKGSITLSGDELSNALEILENTYTLIS